MENQALKTTHTNILNYTKFSKNKQDYEKKVLTVLVNY